MKYRIKKWYTIYDGEFEIEAPDEAKAHMLARDWLANDGLDPDEYQLDIEEVSAPPHEMFGDDKEWDQFKDDNDGKKGKLKC